MATSTAPSIPTTMKRYTPKHRNDPSGLVLDAEAPVPKITSPTEVLVRIRALSLNARDLQIATNGYPAPHPIPENLVPVSDGAGEVVATGSGVTEFKVGDPISPVFPPGHFFEEDMAVAAADRGLCQGLGGARDGVAAEYFVVDQANAVLNPPYMTFSDAASLPVAATTAWTSLFGHHPRLEAGHTVLCLGTGGVSLFAAQFALLSSARVILTSSSNAKLDRCKELLKPLVHPNASETALQTVNYGEVDKWDEEVKRLNGGKGVDFVIEIGGQGTLGRSIRSTRPGGLVAVSGYMSDYGHIPQDVKEEDIAKLILYSSANVRGTFAGNRTQYVQMLRAMEMGGVKPVIDKTFTFDQLSEAYLYLQKAKHIGKVVVTV